MYRFLNKTEKVFGTGADRDFIFPTLDIVSTQNQRNTIDTGRRKESK